MSTSINSLRENLFPAAAIYLGYLLLIIGIMNVIIVELITGAITIFIGSLLSFTFMGIQIDVKNHQYRNYISFLGQKKGTWKTLEDYTNSAVLKSLVKYTSYYKAVIPLQTKETYYDIYLLNSTHRKKLLVERLPNKEQAIHQAKLLADTLQIEYSQTYNPTLSAASRAKRK